MSVRKRIRPLTPQREEKFRRVANQRQLNLSVILENVHDPHNIGAVMRSCDAVGIAEIFVLYTDPQLTAGNLAIGTSSSAGARKWVEVHFFTDAQRCFERVRKTYDRILATHLAEDAKSLYALDLTSSTALLFGNEKDGVSREALAYADGNFIIPQVGMVQSLNISVACAVTLYEAFRQRMLKGLYNAHEPATEKEQHEALFERYYAIHEQKSINKKN